MPQRQQKWIKTGCYHYPDWDRNPKKHKNLQYVKELLSVLELKKSIKPSQSA